jgi:signal peptidase I
MNGNVEKDGTTAPAPGQTVEALLRPRVEKHGTPGPAPGSRAGDPSRQAPKRADNWRETIESIVVAFVLAFLFRTFEAEAFVIPTGSMAPTLYGQHRDVYCAQCGTRFAAGVNSSPGDAEVSDGAIIPGYRSHFAICPNANCRYPNDVLEDEIFAGDRILVNKFPFEFKDPERWDVVVFKFPEQARTNYIKRLAGLPGEELKIEAGNVWFKRLDDPRASFAIARKKPEKQRQLQLLVHDNDHPARELLDAGWPESWDNEATPAWQADSQARSFKIEGDPADSETWHWLRYTNYLPRAADWNQLRAEKSLAKRARPQLIKDFYAYNARIGVGHAASAANRGELPELFMPDAEQWVGDLTLSCTVEVFAPQGELTFELVRGPRRYLCRVDLQTGLGRFAFVHETGQSDEKNDDATFETGLNKPGKHSVSFTDVDDRLCFWVDDRLVQSLDFEGDPTYEPPYSPVDAPGPDTAPVGIAARQATVRVAHLKIERDIYYRRGARSESSSEDKTYKLTDDPDDDKDEFLMLGDNSPRSNDSREWGTTHAVPRHLLIGKAFFVYWPHGVPFLNNGRGFPVARYYEPPSRDGGPRNPPLPRFSVPFYPQVGRMHRIR